MAQIGALFIFTPNTIISSSQVNSNFNTIKTTYNAHDIATTGVHGITGGDTIPSSGQLAPVGSLIPFLDFNGTATYDTNYWFLCDGSTINDPLSILDGETPDDMSNRTIVGFGTEAGGDIGTDPWAQGAVGNASHQIDLQHSHTEGSHSHIVNAHDHTFSTSGTTARIRVTPPYAMPGGGTSDYQVGPGALDIVPGAPPPPDHAGDHIHAYTAAGTTATSSPATSSDAGAGTGNALSTTQSIQMRSIRCRFILRIK